MADEGTTGGTVETRVGPDDWADHGDPPGRPQIVVGGPGTGKTAFLCNRIATAIESGRVSPAETIVLTFSRGGANDIRTRLASLLGSASSRINVSTYHSIAMRIGESHAADLGWASPPSVLAGAEQERFVASLLSREDASAWAVPFRPILTSHEFAAEITDFILRCHEHLKQPNDVAAQDRGLWKGIPAFFDRYLSEQVVRGRTDYGRVLSDAVAAIDAFPALSDPYRLVVADEYQDTSPAQARLLLGIAQHTSDLIVAADPYQSIYSFRGTDLDNVFTFPQATETALGKRAERLILTTSFRVPETILSSAVAVTRRELRGGAGKVLSTRTGGSVSAHTFSMRSEEADWIASDIERLHLLEGVPLERIAVFMRSRTEFAGELATALDQRSLSHTHDESRLSDEPIVRFVRDLVTAATGGDASHDALRRVLLSPYVATPVGAVASLEERHRSGATLTELITEAVDNGDGLAALLADDAWATQASAPVGLWTVWTTLPQLANIATDEDHRSDRRAWTAFAQALDRLTERDPTSTLADHGELAQRSDFEAEPLLDYRLRENHGVTVTTMHRAKGTEFDAVYIADAVEGVFPDLRIEDSLLGVRHLNPHLPTDATEYRLFRLGEERRLAYTAMTRATSSVTWTAVTSGDPNAPQPSRFLTLVADVTEPPDVSDPLTRRSYESWLRRQVADPLVDDVERLAAARVLSHGVEAGLSDPTERYGVVRRGSDAGLVPDELRLSPSQAMGYDTCPRRYAIDKFVLTQGEDSPYLRFGSLIHQVLEDAEREASGHGRLHATAEDAMEHLERVWDESGFGDDAVAAAWHRKAVTTLQDVYDRWPSAGTAIGLETALRMTIGGVPWYGRADRIEKHDEAITIVDYKTGRHATKAEAAESIQLAYYALAAAQDPEIGSQGDISGAEFWYTKNPNKNSLATRSFPMENLGAIRERMIDIQDSIRDENFVPTVNSDCNRCPVEIICPARPAGQEAYAQ